MPHSVIACLLRLRSTCLLVFPRPAHAPIAAAQVVAVAGHRAVQFGWAASGGGPLPRPFALVVLAVALAGCRAGDGWAAGARFIGEGSLAHGAGAVHGWSFLCGGPPRTGERGESPERPSVAGGVWVCFNLLTTILLVNAAYVQRNHPVSSPIFLTIRMSAALRRAAASAGSSRFACWALSNSAFPSARASFVPPHFTR